jgi:hypothetical protein
MAKQFALLTTLAFALVSFPQSAIARSSVSGRITAFTPTSLSINGKEIVTVAIDHRTTFTKWITQKPWGEDTRLDARALRVGSLVSVRTRNDDGSVADWVQIATDMPIRVPAESTGRDRLGDTDHSAADATRELARDHKAIVK